MFFWVNFFNSRSNVGFFRSRPSGGVSRKIHPAQVYVVTMYIYVVTTYTWAGLILRDTPLVGLLLKSPTFDWELKNRL